MYKRGKIQLGGKAAITLALVVAAVGGAATSASAATAGLGDCSKRYCNWTEDNFTSYGVFDSGALDYATYYIPTFGYANDKFNSTYNNYSSTQRFYENSNRTGRYLDIAGGISVAKLSDKTSQLGWGETWRDRFSADR